MVRFGIDRLLAEPEPAPSAGGTPRRAAGASRLRHRGPEHALDALAALDDLRITAAFGPQHGLRGDKQDNMVESPGLTPIRRSASRCSASTARCAARPTQMMGTFDVLLVDLQDLGCRIYTFITTLLYVLEAAARHGKAVWVLDRPNPAGRPVEGLTLRAGWESFVGAGPMPMRHGLTLGELGHWFIGHFKLDVDYRVIEMEGWQPDAAPGLRLAARRAHLDQPEPERAQPLDGARLCRHGDARGHDAVRRARHDAAARTVRRAGHRRRAR